MGDNIHSPFNACCYREHCRESDSLLRAATARIAELDNQLFEMTEMGVKQAQTIRTQQLRIAELEAQIAERDIGYGKMSERMREMEVELKEWEDGAVVQETHRAELEAKLARVEALANEWHKTLPVTGGFTNTYTAQLRKAIAQ